MVQQQPTNDNSGMGVVLGILLAVVIVVGAYFFIQSNNAGDDTGLEPAAGIETPMNDGNATAPAADPNPSPNPAP